LKNQEYINRYLRWSQLRLLFAIVLGSQLSACAHHPATTTAAAPALQFSTDVAVCRDMLAEGEFMGAELDSSNISLLNWNVHKTRERRWREDFDTLASETDLVLFQEASLREETIAEIDSSRHWSFAPGYRKWGEVTGVMTLSSIKPMTQCSFVHSEPWLRTPKATSVTQYALTDTDQSLVVINVHAVNFSFGTGAFEKQFEQIFQVLENHDGPIILSGDLNTWRAKRVEIVSNMANSLELTEVAFDNDHRVQFFGKTLDHIYIRGLHAVDTDTKVVDTSDHNPMTAVFSM
jgi:endonuclease/exonuclease/phosphatase (EEP) superfamily protein YafD